MTDLSVQIHNKALVAQAATPAHDTKHTNEVAYVLTNRDQLSARYVDLSGRFPQNLVAATSTY